MPAKKREPGYKRHDKRNDQVRFQLTVGNRTFQSVLIPAPDDPEHPAQMMKVSPALTMMDLTVLTRVELDALRRFFNDVLDRAEPIVDDLDRIANEAAALGDTSYKRLWRPDPTRLDFPDPTPKEHECSPPTTFEDSSTT